MSDERDAGIAALERGDLEAAAALLANACRQDPDDFAAHYGLGRAMLTLGRPGDAVAAFSRAVSLAPPYPFAHRELGLALAADGKPLEATRALQQALTLRPSDSIALQAYDRLRQQIASARPPASRPVHRTIRQQVSAEPAAPYGGTAASGERAYYCPPVGAAPLLDPDASGEEPTRLVAVAPGVTLAGAPAGHEPAVSVLSPLAAPLPTGRAIPGGGFPSPGEAWQPAMPRAYGTVAPDGRSYGDDFSLSDAYYDLLEVLAAPRDFFAAQVGREGCRAPLSMLAVYTVNVAIGMLAVLFNSGARLGPTGMIVVLMTPFWFLLLFAAITAVAFGCASLLHLSCALFFRHESFSGSFRAFVYAIAPLCTATALGLVISPIQTHSEFATTVLTALPHVLIVSAPIWGLGLLTAALRRIHGLSFRAVSVVLFILALLCAGIGIALNLMLNRPI